MAKEKNARRGVTKLGFVGTFVLPALLIFLVPIISFFFFWHAEKKFNDRAREQILSSIRKKPDLSEDDRTKAITFFQAVPASELVKHEETAAMFAAGMRFDLATFRWAIRLSALSILGGVAVFLFAGVCVLLSSHSNAIQYFTLSAGWHVLRVYGALQAVVQGALLVALSFWVTALWMGRYSPKLIFIAGFVALAAVALVISGIFKPIRNLFEVQGTLLAPEVAGPLWQQLRTLCATVGTNPPDQIVAGIDDNFFVTEQPMIVGGQAIHGRTLYVSLALLKQLDGREADAVLAHEMAHFSGQDTVYSKKISPLLVRYGNYLEALRKGVVTLPIFHFMMCFRALFELSLRRLGRRRETRADRIAVDTTSAQAFAGAMLRIVAYSEYRGKIQQGLFDQERALEKADIGRQVECGFANFAAAFASNPKLGSEETPHPFDSHPPLSQRLATVDTVLGSDTASAILGVPGDGHWYRSIAGAEELERQQWDQFEAQFRAYHEQTLPYRFLPATDEERQIVLAAFPEVSFRGRKGTLTLDYDKMHYSSWPGPLRFAEIVKFVLNDSDVLTVQHKGSGKREVEVKMRDFGNAKQQVLNAINQYYVRYQMAVNYQKEKMVKAQRCPETGTGNLT